MTWHYEKARRRWKQAERELEKQIEIARQSIANNDSLVDLHQQAERELKEAQEKNEGFARHNMIIKARADSAEADRKRYEGIVERSDKLLHNYRLKVALEEAEGKLERVRETSQALLDKWEQVAGPIADAFQFKQLHGMTYNGPTINAELDNLRLALADEGGSGDTKETP